MNKHLSVIFASCLMAAPLCADMADTINSTVDKTATSTKGKADTGAAKTDGAVTNFLGTNVLTSSVTQKVDTTAGSAKGKTDTGAAKIKKVTGAAKTKKTDARAAADQKVNSAANSAAGAIQKIGQ